MCAIKKHLLILCIDWNHPKPNIQYEEMNHLFVPNTQISV